MPDFDTHPTGAPAWIDLLSPDVDASKAFYSAVFGWEAEDQHDEDGTRIYVNFRKDGKLVAGLGGTMPGMPADVPATWNTYVAVADADATAAAVEAAGGTVMMPVMQVMSAGRMAIFGAPDGAAVSVWEPGDHRGAEVANEDGTWSWNELLSRDLDAAKPFYETVFGWAWEEQDMGPAGTYSTGLLDGRQIAGAMAMPQGVPDRVPSFWGVYFMVDSLEDASERIVAAGGQLVDEPMSGPGIGSWVMAHDPQHGSFSVLQPEQT